MTDAAQREAANAFYNNWNGVGYEKGDTQRYWIALLSDVLGMEDVTGRIEFEKEVRVDGQTKFIDAYLPRTRVLIEQKSLKIDLDKPQQGHDGKTPYEQAFEYNTWLPTNETANWIVVSNFAEIRIYNMNETDPVKRVQTIELKNLPFEYHYLNFLTNESILAFKKEMEVSIKAGDIVGRIYDALRKQYHNPDAEESARSLNALCVRLVFCMYAEDAGIFGKKDLFADYMDEVPAPKWGRELRELFKMLDTPEAERDGYDPALEAFPYVNGGLFSDESIEIPLFTEEIKQLIITDGCREFDWREISPTIFGAVFESTLNPETRRAGGMHYTSLENIHKVIDPLFLNDLREELSAIREITAVATRKTRLNEFQDKLAGLTFLDPACGSGNFLTEGYLSLRRLENELIRERLNLEKLNRSQMDGQIVFMDEAVANPIRVSIRQFYGIEINDFAATVAKTALWIAESQMMKQTEDVIHANLSFLPLKTYANIVEGNALRMDWESVVPVERLDYIMGNPPFVGYSLQSKEQKEDILSIYVDEKGKPYKTAGKIDYVAGWYFKASQLMVGTKIRTALVSTNSITQGEQVAGVWKPLFERFDIQIDFAYRTFRWDSESNSKAHVHCVIVGFSQADLEKEKVVYSDGKKTICKNINAYLVDADDVFVESRKSAICASPDMVYGNKPTDGGFLFLSKEEYDEIKRNDPAVMKYIKRIYGASEFINNKPRYCLWLVGVSPKSIKESRFIMDRVNKVKEYRLASSKEATRKSAETPTLFQEIRHTDSEYIIVPRHSSETRRYIPFGFVSPDIVVNDAVQMIPDATLYDFGILTSNVHMSWVRTVCGRIKSDYRYSKDIVYNNFPWPTPTDEQRTAIEKTAQAILDARELYPDSSLADLYDPTLTPPELQKAHQANNIAVMKAYGFDYKTMDEDACVAELMKLYQQLVTEQA
ncbi:MAG: class I SAM-dependent DNA methyltransferase [Eubacterium sp.]|nr:class I SAM-dependent DNA methyltransferase [Eubacterium sp.]